MRSASLGAPGPIRRLVEAHPGAFRALFHAFVLVCVLIDIYLVYLILRSGGFIHDSHAYWSVNVADPYSGKLGERDAFLYAAAINLGFRFPWTWALMLLTKVTPGIGLLWFAVRREWRALGIALGATAAIVVVSYLVAPDLWRQWVDLLTVQSGGDVPELAAVRVPLVVRVVIAAVIVAWGAWTDRPWVLPIAVLLAQPVIWVASLSILVGILPLRGAQGRVRAAQVPRSSRAWYRA
jgi:hypothetical protein